MISNLYLIVKRESALYVVPEEAWFAQFLSFGEGFFDVWDKWVKLFHNGSPRSVTDRRRLTGRQTFVMRGMNLSTDRIIFSLLGHQRWRERLAYGDVVVLEVIQGPVLAWGFMDVRFSSLRDMVVVGFKNLWEGRTRPGVPKSSLARMKLTTWTTRVRVIQCTNTRKRHVWSVLFI